MPVAPAQAVRTRSVPRLLGRKAAFKQSKGHLKIHRGPKKVWYSVIINDLSHRVLGFKVYQFVLLYVSTYTLFCIIFACLYRAVSSTCGIQLTTVFRALYFSLEIQSSIGWGVPSIYFQDCVPAFFLITIHVIVSGLWHATMLAFVIARVLRPTKTAYTVVLSDKAVLRFIDGRLYFMFRAAEMLHSPPVEAHVRCYAVSTPDGAAEPFQHTVMRLSHPDDELGGWLLLTLPSFVSHQVDAWSPLIPPAFASPPPFMRHDAVRSYRWPEILQRELDAVGGNRNGQVCDACGETFNTAAHLQAHVAYNRVSDTVSGHDVRTSCRICGQCFPSASHLALHDAQDHSASTNSYLKTGVPQQPECTSTGGSPRGLANDCCSGRQRGLPDQMHFANQSHIFPHMVSSAYTGRPCPATLRAAVQRHLVESNIEILVLLELIEPLTSNQLQVRHSYTAADIVWDASFAPCVEIDEETDHAYINFSKFHDLVPALPT